MPERETRDRNLQLLLDISTRLSRRPRLAELYPTILGSIVEIFPLADAASIWLLEGVDIMRPQAWVGHPDQAMRSLVLPINRSLLGKIVDSEGPIVVADTQADDRFEAVNPELDHVRSVAGAAMRLDGAVVGMLFADSYEHENAFTNDEGLLLQAIADQVAVALENAQLIAALELVPRRIMAAQESERRRLSRDLHDEAGSELAAIQFRLENLALDHPESAPDLRDSAEMVRVVQDRLRGISMSLSPPVLGEYGLLPAVRSVVGRFVRTRGLKVEMSATVHEDRRFSREVEVAAYRLVQESLTNVGRHAEASAVFIGLDADDERLSVEVRDNGCGFDVATMDVGIGLTGMRERVEALNGTMTTESSESGTRVKAAIPLEADTKIA